MVAYTVNNAAAGTSLVSAAGTVTSITVTAAPTITDAITPVSITDGPGGRTIFCATLLALIFLFEPRPGVALTPGTTTPVFPRTLFSGSQAFAHGLYVQSCPPGVIVTVNA